MPTPTRSQFLRAPQRKPRLLTCYSGDLHELDEVPTPPCVIEGLLLAQSLTLFTGPTGTGRSMIALDMALSIASGRPYLGRPTRQGFALYIAGDQAGGIAKRLGAWKQFYGQKEVRNFYLIPDGVQLHQSAVHEQLERRLQMCCQETGLPPGLVIIDTLSWCSFGLSENNPRHMGHFLDCARALSEGGAAVLIIHDLNKRGGVRGSSRIVTGCEGHLTLTPTYGEHRHEVRLRVEKLEGGQRGAQWTLAPRVQHLAHLLDGQGRPETSVVFAPVEAARSAKKPEW